MIFIKIEIVLIDFVHLFIHWFPLVWGRFFTSILSFTIFVLYFSIGFQSIKWPYSKVSLCSYNYNQNDSKVLGCIKSLHAVAWLTGVIICLISLWWEKKPNMIVRYQKGQKLHQMLGFQWFSFKKRQFYLKIWKQIFEDCDK